MIDGMDTDKFDWQSRINIDPGIMGGKPVIMGRRVLIEVILQALSAGDSVQDVCEEFLIAESDVRAALAYAGFVVSRHQPPMSPGEKESILK